MKKKNKKLLLIAVECQHKTQRNITKTGVNTRGKFKEQKIEREYLLRTKTNNNCSIRTGQYHIRLEGLRLWNIYRS